MSANSKIEWTDHTFNPWTGCTKVSPGCDGCYAEAWSKRAGPKVGKWGPGMPRVRTAPANWSLPRRWNAQADAFMAQHGRRQRVFCASLADVFDNAVDPVWRADLFELIQATPALNWLLLTKRIGNVGNMLPVPFDFDRLYPNVWLGATIVNQAEADRDIPKLLDVPARVRFLSMEPLLGPVELGLQCENWSDDIVMDPETGAYDCCRACDYTGIGNAIDWVIAGGESGPGARPMHPQWARSLRDQCQAAGVPFLFKQWGEWLPWHQFCDAEIDDPPEQTRFETREWENGAWRDVGKPDYWATMDGDIDDEQCVGRVGKKAAGRLLDGRTHDEAPQ